MVGKGGSILIPFQITMDIQSTEPKLNKWLAELAANVESETLSVKFWYPGQS